MADKKKKRAQQPSKKTAKDAEKHSAEKGKKKNAGAREPDYNAKSESLAFSLTRLTPDKIAPSPAIDPGAAAAEKRARYTRLSVLILCVMVFAGSLYSIFNTLAGYRRAEDFYTELADGLIENDNSRALKMLAAESATPSFGTRISGGDSTSLDRALYERMKTRLSSLTQVNPDICGWINIPGTKHVNYPILQGQDNDYYLDREYTGGYLAAGSIFVDYRCDRDFNANHNTVIYGHNMQNGMMFSELINYLDEDYFNANKYVYIYTEFGVYTYEVFAVFKTNYQYKYIETAFPAHSDFVDFAYEMKGNSIYERPGIEFDENSRIITLSTCTNGLWTDRYCIQALLVDAYND